MVGSNFSSCMYPLLKNNKLPASTTCVRFATRWRQCTRLIIRICKVGAWLSHVSQSFLINLNTPALILWNQIWEAINQ